MIDFDNITRKFILDTSTRPPAGTVLTTIISMEYSVEYMHQNELSSIGRRTNIAYHENELFYTTGIGYEEHDL